MAAAEMYDYLTTITPDYTATTLSVTPHSVLSQMIKKAQVVHEFDDGNISVATLGSTAFFEVTLQWDILTASDAGTILDFWADSAKANGMERSFYWQHPVDGHTYVVHFLENLTTDYHHGWGNNYHEVQQIKLLVKGRKADS